MFEGYGVFFWDTGKRYEGHWKSGLFDGVGKLTYNNGDIYQGDYVRGKREGTGSFSSLKDKMEYKGSWKRGLQHGQGLLMVERNGAVPVRFKKGILEVFLSSSADPINNKL